MIQQTKDSKTSKMKLLMTSVNGFQLLTKVTENHIKDVM